MQLGFVIDHSRCIGCHACTVACKAENDVSLGKFRTWVKYTERGTYPDVRRSFAVLRCNQCTDAPCVAICPVRALDKRSDGIVDIDPKACIGCKACMQACPYDALYLDPDEKIAEKCHFCAHRVEAGLAPACAVICPTEAIIPGDFHDPESRVSTLRREHDLQARKTEAGTSPNVLYREVDPAGIEPLATDASGGFLWADRLPGTPLSAESFDAAMESAEDRARTTYSTDHPPVWGWKVSAYLFTKGIAAGTFLTLALMMARLRDTVGAGGTAETILPLLSLAFLAATVVLLVADLGKPTRFLYILTRPNPGSWLVRGAWILMAFGAVASAWFLLAWRGIPMAAWTWAVLAVGALLAVLAAGYTGWLFEQARGRALWLRPGLWLVFVIQSLVAGSAVVTLLAIPLEVPAPAMQVARWTLVLGLALRAVSEEFEKRVVPRNREAEYRRALRLIHKGPFAARRILLADIVGYYLPIPILVLFPFRPTAWAVAAVLALIGVYVEDDNLVRAGQALPIS